MDFSLKPKSSRSPGTRSRYKECGVGTQGNRKTQGNSVTQGNRVTKGLLKSKLLPFDGSGVRWEMFFVIGRGLSINGTGFKCKTVINDDSFSTLAASHSKWLTETKTIIQGLSLTMCIK